MAEYNIALLNQMKMNRTLNFSDFASIRFADNQQQARMMDDSAATVYSWLRQLSVTLARLTKLKKKILHLAASAPSPTDDTLPFLHVHCTTFECKIFFCTSAVDLTSS